MFILSGGNNHFIKFYSGCSLFNKYRYYNLWVGSLDEYIMIKYCEYFMGKYVFFMIQEHLITNYGYSFYHKICFFPPFVNFLNSGFVKHLNFFFLTLLYKYCLASGIKPKNQVEQFCNEYFHRYIKSKLEEDILLFIAKYLRSVFPLMISRRLMFLILCPDQKYNKVGPYVHSLGSLNKFNYFDIINRDITAKQVSEKKISAISFSNKTIYSGYNLSSYKSIFTYSVTNKREIKAFRLILNKVFPGKYTSASLTSGSSKKGGGLSPGLLIYRSNPFSETKRPLLFTIKKSFCLTQITKIFDIFVSQGITINISVEKNLLLTNIKKYYKKVPHKGR